MRVRGQVLSGKPRAATVRAVGPTRCIRIGAEVFARLTKVLETPEVDGAAADDGEADEEALAALARAEVRLSVYGR